MRLVTSSRLLGVSAVLRAPLGGEHAAVHVAARHLVNPLVAAERLDVGEGLAVDDARQDELRSR
jgi:hypothetical protein